MTTTDLARPKATPQSPGGSPAAPGPRLTAAVRRRTRLLRHTGTHPGRRKITWDLLRCVCVLMVVLYHSTFIGPSLYRRFWPREFVFGHQIGASLLLAISAYFIAASLGGQQTRASARGWWLDKLARLLPPFVVATVAAWCSLRCLAPPGMDRPSLDTLWANLAMLWNWHGLSTWSWVDGSYWTIPLQLLAFTVAAGIRRSRLGHGRGLRVLLWAAVLIPLAQWDVREHSSGLYLAIVDGFGLYRWQLFVAGVAVWMLATGRLGRRHGTALLATCLAAHAVQIGELTSTGRFTTDGWSVLGVGVGVLAMVFSACGPDVAAQLPGRVVRAISWLAGISYGVFLVHQTQGFVVMLWLQDAFGVGPGMQTLAMLAVAVVGGWALTRGVERPARRLLTRQRAAPTGRPGCRRDPDRRAASPMRVVRRRALADSAPDAS